MITKKCKTCGSELKMIGTKEVMGRSFNIFEDCVKCKETLEQEKVLKQEELKQQERKKMYDKLVQSNIGRRYYHNNFETMEIVSPSFETALKRSKRYCEVADKVKAKGQGIYFYGDNGRGKTGIVACMVKALIKNGYSPYVINLVELTGDLINDRVDIEDIKTKDFLFVEDIGSENVSKGSDPNWISEKLFEIVLYRDKELLPTCFTSNIKVADLLKMGMMKKIVERISTLSTVKLEIITPQTYREKKEVALF